MERLLLELPRSGSGSPMSGANLMEVGSPSSLLSFSLAPVYGSNHGSVVPSPGAPAAGGSFVASAEGSCASTSGSSGGGGGGGSAGGSDGDGSGDRGAQRGIPPGRSERGRPGCGVSSGGVRKRRRRYRPYGGRKNVSVEV